MLYNSRDTCVDVCKYECVCVLVVFVGRAMNAIIIWSWRCRPDPVRVRFARSLENNYIMSLLLPSHNRKAGVHLCNYVNVLCASPLSSVWSTCGVLVVGVHSGIRESTACRLVTNGRVQYYTTWL